MIQKKEITPDWYIVYECTQRKRGVPVHVQVREPSSGARLGRVIDEYNDTREEIYTENTGNLAVMTKQQYSLMLSNYELGGCDVTWKGVMRYSAAHYCSKFDSWYGQPGQTARVLVSTGVPCPKEIFSLFLKIGDSV